MATPNLIDLILRYRRKVNDTIKKDGEFYTSTTMSEGTNAVNAGAQTNQEIADLATESVNFFIDLLAQANEKVVRAFQTYSMTAKYIPEYVTTKVQSQIGVWPAPINNELEIDTTDLYGYPVSAWVKHANGIDTANFVDASYAKEREAFAYDEEDYEPQFYLEGTSTTGKEIVVVLYWNRSPVANNAVIVDTGTFYFKYIQRQANAVVDTTEIKLNPKYYDKIVEIMIKKNDSTRGTTRQ